MTDANERDREKARELIRYIPIDGSTEKPPNPRTFAVSSIAAAIANAREEGNALRKKLQGSVYDQAQELAKLRATNETLKDELDDVASYLPTLYADHKTMSGSLSLREVAEQVGATNELQARQIEAWRDRWANARERANHHRNRATIEWMQLQLTGAEFVHRIPKEAE